MTEYRAAVGIMHDAGDVYPEMVWAAGDVVPDWLIALSPDLLAQGHVTAVTTDDAP